MENKFSHEVLKLNHHKPLIYTAMSKHLFYYRMFISKFVLEKGGVPLNPFMIFDYFLTDSVDRNVIREANNNLVKRSDELWVFGTISNGVLAEIQIAQLQRKPIKYFKISDSLQIIPANNNEIELEKEIQSFKDSIAL